MRVAAAPPAPFDALPGSPLILRDGTVATIRAAGPRDRDCQPLPRGRRVAIVTSPTWAASAWTSRLVEPWARRSTIS